jgi:hypothetical protein
MTTKYHYVKPHRVQFVHVLLRWITSGYRPNYSLLIRYYLSHVSASGIDRNNVIPSNMTRTVRSHLFFVVPDKPHLVALRMLQRLAQY